jgi:DNA-binding NarL/FixJ family response regulator
MASFHASVSRIVRWSLDMRASSPSLRCSGGFLLKDATAEELIHAVRVIAHGNGLLSPQVTREVIEHFAHNGIHAVTLPPGNELTARERDVLALVARGLSNAEIAEQLTVSEPTVKTHVAHILGKLGLRNRVQAVVYAYEHRVT